MATGRSLLSLTALIALTNISHANDPVPPDAEIPVLTSEQQAGELSPADAQILVRHWRECHPELALPARHELVGQHMAREDEPRHRPDDHFDLYMQAIAAIDCDVDLHGDNDE